MQWTVQNPSDPQQLLKQAKTLIQERQFRKATALMKNFSYNSKAILETGPLMALIAYKQKRYDDALIELTGLKMKDTVETCYLRGKTQKKLGRLNEALQEFESAHRKTQEEEKIDENLRLKISFHKSILEAKFGNFDQEVIFLLYDCLRKLQEIVAVSLIKRKGLENKISTLLKTIIRYHLNTDNAEDAEKVL